MVNHNRLRAVWRGLACCKSYQRFVSPEDLSSFDLRSANEGIEYYARQFGQLRSDLLAALEKGSLEVTARFGLKRTTRLPRFLFGAWCLIFDEDGVLRDQVDVDAVNCVNQLLAVFTKLEGGHTPESEELRLRSFTEIECELKSNPLDRSKLVGSVPIGNIIDRARTRICRVLAGSDPREIVPRHGNGAVANGLSNHAKWRNPYYDEQLSKIWPYDEFCFLNSDHWLESLEQDQPYDVPRAKILLVPKDVKGPRIISCEPSTSMWFQQGLMDLLYKTIEAHPWTSGFVNFTEQEHNQRLALLGSLPAIERGESYATLDLKDASDRVRMDLVEQLFPENWVAALHAVRSPTTVLPCGTEVELVKHAPMGSAVCFPVMALVIWALITASNSSLRRETWVYGDDVVVPARDYNRVVSVLESVQLSVNRNKSFATGFYRESCGKEYYRGRDITPVRLRSPLGDGIADQVRLTCFSNNLFGKLGVEPYLIVDLISRWYPQTPIWELRKHQLTDLIILSENVGWDGRVELRDTDKLAGMLFVQLHDGKPPRRRKSKRYQRLEYRVPRYVARKESYPTDDWSQVFRSLHEKRERSILGSDAVSSRGTYKYGWTAL